MTVATPDKVVSDLVQTGEAFIQLPDPYGQQNCQGQGIVEISNSSFGNAVGLFVESTWNPGLATAPCATRRSQYTIWVQLDGDRSDGGQMSSPSEGWHIYDQVSASGISLVEGMCSPEVQCRMKDWPPSTKAQFCQEPVSYVDLNRNAASGRVTAVKVIAQSSANCAALPLEFTINPTDTSP